MKQKANHNKHPINRQTQHYTLIIYKSNNIPHKYINTTIYPDIKLNNTPHKYINTTLYTGIKLNNTPHKHINTTI